MCRCWVWGGSTHQVSSSRAAQAFSATSHLPASQHPSIPAPGPDTRPNGQHHSALQSSTLRHGPANIIPTDIYTFYYCVTNLFLCKVSTWLEYDLTNHHASAQKSTRPLLLSSSARPEPRCGYLYLCGPAEDAWLRHRCGWWVVAGGKQQLALCLHSGTAHVPWTHVHH